LLNPFRCIYQEYAAIEIFAAFMDSELGLHYPSVRHSGYAAILEVGLKYLLEVAQDQNVCIQVEQDLYFRSYPMRNCESIIDCCRTEMRSV
jgi:hypothetical protein